MGRYEVPKIRSKLHLRNILGENKWKNSYMKHEYKANFQINISNQEGKLLTYFFKLRTDILLSIQRYKKKIYKTITDSDSYINNIGAFQTQVKCMKPIQWAIRSILCMNKIDQMTPPPLRKKLFIWNTLRVLDKIRKKRREKLIKRTHTYW